MDISEIAPGLYVASSFYPPDADMPPIPVLLDVTTFDDSELDYAGQAEAMRFAICTEVLRSAGYDVVLRCTAGRNRSALVAALVLIDEGLPPTDAINIVTEKRTMKGGVLTNRSFVDFLLDQEQSG